VTPSFTALERRIDELYASSTAEPLPGDAEDAVTKLLDALQRGQIRAAERSGDGVWRAVPWVKRGILVAFRAGDVVDFSLGSQPPTEAAGSVASRHLFSFFDKHTLLPRAFSLGDGVRIVPGGSTIRRGAYVAPGVVCMPPMFVNVGAWVGTGTMIDSHALVGSCAQIGDRVHLSAAAQVGGVLEPVNASPVVIEDDVIVGGNCGVYEGTVVHERAVLAAGVVLTRGTPVYDLVRERVYRGDAERPLEIPSGAVVVPGARAVRSTWGAGEGLSLQTPVVVKYRDEKTDTATTLEQWLR
jgi:2,3,4,5-tetrahydropyridine-2-carboxylate N-succinyltransferase